jgi:lipid II:glycine glycyltransferase (peptidoglycan interpeptide bridge formation enzyme)
MSQYPYFEVLSYQDPGEREKWRAVCQSFKDMDIFYYPEYVYLFELKGDGKAQCFVYYDENGIVISPFLKRQINEVECFSALSDNIMDISSPYGYAGYLRNHDQVDMNKFYEIFKDYCKKNNVVSEFIRFHPLIDNLSYSPVEIASHKVNETVIINLSLTPEEIWQNLTPSCRNKVRKARKAELAVVQDKQFENLDKFHKLYTNTMERLGAQQYYFFPLEWFYSLVELLENDVALFHTRWENTIIMSGLFLLSDQYIHYYLSGSDYGLSHLPANNLLLFEVALWAKNRGINFFHLGGGSQPKDNLFKFKASFSPLRASYHIGKVIHSSEIYKHLCGIRSSVGKSGADEKDFFPAYRNPFLEGLA